MWIYYKCSNWPRAQSDIYHYNIKLFSWELVMKSKLKWPFTPQCIGSVPGWLFSWATPQWESPVSSQNRNPISVPDLNGTLAAVRAAQKAAVKLARTKRDMCFSFVPATRHTFISRPPPPSSSPSSACFQFSLTCWRRQQLTLICHLSREGSNQTRWR